MVVGRQGIRVSYGGPIPCHLTPWPGHRTTTRFKRQPAAPIHAHHSIAKDSDHNAGNGETETAMQMPNPTSRSGLWRTKRSRSQYESRTENLHGAYLAYTRRRTRETKSEKGGDDGQGRKNPGEETTAKKSSAPAADTRPAL